MPCTKGLWLWNVPIQASNSHHSDFRLLIIDSEGIGSFSANETYDTQVFALALMLSSFFMYNSIGNIDDNAITRLGLVTELSKYIKSKLNNEYHSIFPFFMWIVRDFTLELKDKHGESITSREYLENALSFEDRVASETEKAKQQIKTSLKQYFKERDCFTLIRPIHDERKLQNAAKVDISDIREEFRNQIEQLREFIFTTIKPKEFGGRYLNGRMFVGLCENYCTALNEGGIVIDSCWSNVVKSECEMIHSESFRIYTSKMSRFLKHHNAFVEMSALEDCHFESESEAMNNFVDMSKVVMKEFPSQLEALQNAITTQFKKYREDVKNLSMQNNSDIISAIFSQMPQFDSQTRIEDINSLLRSGIEGVSIMVTLN